jgi:hypothetical protein
VSLKLAKANKRISVLFDRKDRVFCSRVTRIIFYRIRKTGRNLRITLEDCQLMAWRWVCRSRSRVLCLFYLEYYVRLEATGVPHTV